MRWLVKIITTLKVNKNYHNTTNILNVQLDKHEDEVEAAASAAAKQLGYGAFKNLPLKVIKEIATGRLGGLCLLCCQLAMARAYVMNVVWP